MVSGTLQRTARLYQELWLPYRAANILVSETWDIRSGKFVTYNKSSGFGANLGCIKLRERRVT